MCLTCRLPGSKKKYAHANRQLRSEQICFAHKKPVGFVGDDGHHDGQQESAEHMLTRCDSASWEKPFYEFVLIAHDMSHKACILG